MEPPRRLDRRARRAHPQRPLSVTIRWVAVLFGAATGLGASLVAFVILGIVGAIDASSDSIPLLLVIYSAQLLSGYIAGRYAGENRGLHGGLAALALFAISAALAVAAGTEPSVLTIVFSLTVAAIIGTAGGALADWKR